MVIAMAGAHAAGRDRLDRRLSTKPSRSGHRPGPSVRFTRSVSCVHRHSSSGHAHAIRVCSPREQARHVTTGWFRRITHPRHPFPKPLPFPTELLNRGAAEAPSHFSFPNDTREMRILGQIRSGGNAPHLARTLTRIHTLQFAIPTLQPPTPRVKTKTPSHC